MALWPLLTVALGSYLGLVGLMTLNQDHLLYLPDPRPPTPASLAGGPGGPALAPWPAASDGELRGYLQADPVAKSGQRGTVVVFHGNAGSARDRRYYLGALEPRGFRVVLAEYPGYGGRAGTPSEATLIADARATARQALDDFGAPLWLWGESLGAAVAAGAAADPGLPVAGLVLITPWDNLPDLAQALYWYLPARWLVRDRFDTRAALRAFRQPVAVLVAERDEIIPSGHSARLFEALHPPKRRWVFTGAGHNHWPARANAVWWDEVADWLERTSTLADR